MAEPTIDHLALPCFDLAATHRFYSGIMRLPLVHAESGAAGAWGAGEYLLVAYGLRGGVAIDFFTFDGIVRPSADGLPKDIRHIALVVPTRAEVLAYKDRLAESSVAFWTESHESDDEHVYTTDPNGFVLEILSEEDSVSRRKREASDPESVLERWLLTRPASTGHELQRATEKRKATESEGGR
jgi:catechol 2,3-dioxygenase-like lactoylglutathione lyase family enzyme